MDLDSRYQRDAEALEQARGIMMNKTFFLVFFIVVLVSIIGLLTIGISHLPGWILVAVVAIVGGGAQASGKMDTLMTLGVAGIAAASGVVSAIVATYVIFGIQ